MTLFPADDDPGIEVVLGIEEVLNAFEVALDRKLYPIFDTRGIEEEGWRGSIGLLLHASSQSGYAQTTS